MTNSDERTSVIPDAAVRLAGQALRDAFDWGVMDFDKQARLALEAAAPHMLAEAKAEVWDECEATRHLVMMKADGSGLVRVKENPYRITTPYRTEK